MEMVQALFDRSGGTTFTLPPGEYQGPLVIRRSCTVEGAGATLWSGNGPVLVVEAPQVTIRNLRVEVTGRQLQPAQQTAVQVKAQSCQLENVEVAGLVTGLKGEAEDWCLPRLIDCGSFAAGQDNSFYLELWLPQAAMVENLMEGVQLQPAQLQPGWNRLELHTGEISDNTILYGEFLLKTAQVSRRVFVKGEAEAAAGLQRDAKPRSMEPRQMVPKETKPARSTQAAGTLLVRGQRQELPVESFTLKYLADSHPQGADLNFFVFCLGKDGRASGDEDLVFFNQTASADGAIHISQKDRLPQVEVELGRASARIEKYVISLALYEPAAGLTLGSLSSPRLELEAGGKTIFTLPLEGLNKELIVNALELYRYKGAWRLSFVGAGYEAGLARLCKDYGIQVE